MRTSAPHRTIVSRFDNAILGLAGEIGELADYWKKHKYHGHVFDPTRAIQEIGDILWYVAQAADAMGIELEYVAITNIAKLKARYPEGFSNERSINRDE